jgi:hypothetical protein
LKILQNYLSHVDLEANENSDDGHDVGAVLVELLLELPDRELLRIFIIEGLKFGVLLGKNSRFSCWKKRILAFYKI